MTFLCVTRVPWPAGVWASAAAGAGRGAVYQKWCGAPPGVVCECSECSRRLDPENRRCGTRRLSPAIHPIFCRQPSAIPLYFLRECGDVPILRTTKRRGRVDSCIHVASSSSGPAPPPPTRPRSFSRPRHCTSRPLHCERSATHTPPPWRARLLAVPTRTAHPHGVHSSRECAGAQLASMLALMAIQVSGAIWEGLWLPSQRTGLGGEGRRRAAWQRGGGWGRGCVWAVDSWAGCRASCRGRCSSMSAPRRHLGLVPRRATGGTRRRGAVGKGVWVERRTRRAAQLRRRRRRRAVDAAAEQLAQCSFLHSHAASHV